MSSLQLSPLPPIQSASAQGRSLPSIRSILPPSTNIDEQRRLPPPPSFPSSTTSYHPQSLSDIRKLPRLFSPQGLKGHSFPVRFPTGDAVVGRRRVSGPRSFSGPTGRLGGGPFVRRLSPTFPLSNHPLRISLQLAYTPPHSPRLEKLQTSPSSPSQPLPSSSSVVSQVVSTFEDHPTSLTSTYSLLRTEKDLELASSEWNDDQEEAEEDGREGDLEEASSRRLGEAGRRRCSQCHSFLPLGRFSIITRGRRVGTYYGTCDLCRERCRQSNRRSRTRLASQYLRLFRTCCSLQSFDALAECCSIPPSFLPISSLLSEASAVDASDGESRCCRCFHTQPVGNFGLHVHTGKRLRTCIVCKASINRSEVK
ncbi:hypothetical protein BDY24DRAFT_394570, partial [Mrakia frigida]|uniref:uncharacterized protein n=1 Tax=Mrakia frigida TaxID=29902 RepID=UPI003FCC1BFC